MIIRWTTVDLLEGEEPDLTAGADDLFWVDREDAVENVEQGVADGFNRRLLRVELKVTRVTEEKLVGPGDR